MKRSTGLASTTTGCPTSTNLNWCILFPALGLSSLISELIIIQAPKGTTRTQESVLFFAEKSQLLTQMQLVTYTISTEEAYGKRIASQRAAQVTQRQSVGQTRYRARPQLKNISALLVPHQRSSNAALEVEPLPTVLQSPLYTQLCPSLNPQSTTSSPSFKR